MPIIKVMLVRGFRAEQIDFPLAENEKPGAVHFSRNRIVNLREDQFEYLRENRSDLFACLEVIPTVAVSARAKRMFAGAKAAKKAAEAKAKPSKAKLKAKAKAKPEIAKESDKPKG